MRRNQSVSGALASSLRALRRASGTPAARRARHVRPVAAVPKPALQQYLGRGRKERDLKKKTQPFSLPLKVHSKTCSDPLSWGSDASGSFSMGERCFHPVSLRVLGVLGDPSSTTFPAGRARHLLSRLSEQYLNYFSSPCTKPFSHTSAPAEWPRAKNPSFFCKNLGFPYYTPTCDLAPHLPSSL